jgi:hypothetical protein
MEAGAVTTISAVIVRERGRSSDIPHMFNDDPAY